MIKSVRHTGIVVRDLEKAANFYRALGFIDSNHALEEGKFINQVTGLLNAKLEMLSEASSYLNGAIIPVEGGNRLGS